MTQAESRRNQLNEGHALSVVRQAVNSPHLRPCRKAHIDAVPPNRPAYSSLNRAYVDSTIQVEIFPDLIFPPVAA